MSEKVNYKKLSSAAISDKRNIVISECSIGGYTLAQQMVVEESGNKTEIYLKNAIHVDSLDGLKNLRDSLDSAIKSKEN